MCEREREREREGDREIEGARALAPFGESGGSIFCPWALRGCGQQPCLWCGPLDRIIIITVIIVMISIT